VPGPPILHKRVTPVSRWPGPDPGLRFARNPEASFSWMLLELAMAKACAQAQEPALIRPCREQAAAGPSSRTRLARRRL